MPDRRDAATTCAPCLRIDTQALASEAFASVRPEHGKSFECSIPELTTVCIDDEQCAVGETVRENMLKWLCSKEKDTINFEHRGNRIFRYDAAVDEVSMSYFAPDGDMKTASWPWDDAFFALYEWDMMC